MKNSDPNAASKLLSDLKSKTFDEQYKSHSKTHASIGNKPTTTQWSHNQHKPTTEGSKSTNINKRLSRMYDKMEKHYFRKLGLLGEVEFQQPLVKRYGDRYFEYMLRDRYKDDDKSTHAYLYQVRQGEDSQQPTELEMSASSTAFDNAEQGFRLAHPQYMELLGINKLAKERYSSSLK